MCKEERSQAFYLPVDSLKIVFKNSKNQKNKQTKQKKKKIKQVFSSAYFHIFLHTQKKIYTEKWFIFFFVFHTSRTDTITLSQFFY